MKIGIIVSPGGHLDQALLVMEAFQNHEVFLISYVSENLKGFTYHGIKRTYWVKAFGDTKLGVFFSLLLSCFYFIKIFWREKPVVLFSTGAEITVPAFYIGKYLFGSALIFLESATRVKTPSLAGKLIFPIADLFLVQWDSLREILGEKARYVGRVI